MALKIAEGTESARELQAFVDASTSGLTFSEGIASLSVRRSAAIGGRLS